jgi:hypothetical protein
MGMQENGKRRRNELQEQQLLMNETGTKLQMQKEQKQSEKGT